MRRQFSLARWFGAALAALGAVLAQAHAADRVVAGTLGGQAPLWPFYIALHKGFLAAEGIDMELNFAPSGSGITQQLAAGSLDVVVSVGVDDPMQAIDKGAALAIIRIIGKSAPYALIARPTIKTIEDLRGKTISSGSPVDITTVYLERMMAAHGLKKGDYDMISGGVAAARYAALQAGVADAAMVLPPLNFHAEKAGFHTIALLAEYVNDFPFTGMAVYRPWAEAHRDVVRRLLTATDQSIAWFEDPSHRTEAIELLVSVGKASPEDADASYDFLRKIDYFEASPKVSRVRLQNLITVESGRGLVDSALSVDRLVMPGITELAP
jgi:NitT/TauT family transport system substrate-binding protein